MRTLHGEPCSPKPHQSAWAWRNDSNPTDKNSNKGSRGVTNRLVFFYLYRGVGCENIIIWGPGRPKSQSQGMTERSEYVKCSSPCHRGGMSAANTRSCFSPLIFNPRNCTSDPSLECQLSCSSPAGPSRCPTVLSWFTRTLPYFAFFAVIKYWPKAPWGEKGLFQTTVYSSWLREIKAELKK